MTTSGGSKQLRERNEESQKEKQAGYDGGLHVGLVDERKAISRVVVTSVSWDVLAKTAGYIYDSGPQLGTPTACRRDRQKASVLRSSVIHLPSFPTYLAPACR